MPLQHEGVIILLPINVHSKRCCAVCRHWNDPANLCIKPVAPKFGQWDIDERQRRLCLLTNSKETKGNELCSKFECKL